jgi:dCTP deaminase
MSIKSDRWIRRMAEQHGMIEPFEPGQVRDRAVRAACVSYGTSSYGYDVRCARRVQDLHQHQLGDRRSEKLR